jgi:hypothetical protein
LNYTSAKPRAFTLGLQAVAGGRNLADEAGWVISSGVAIFFLKPGASNHDGHPDRNYEF